MGWTYLAIFFAVSMVICLCGFKKYVYFMSLGYGFSVAGIGLSMIILSLVGEFEAEFAHYILFVLMIVYGIRLSGFLLIRELKSASYKKTFNEVVGDESKMPIFVKIVMWLAVCVLYVAQTSPVSFRLINGDGVSAFVWVGIVIAVLGIILEAEADREKSAQKAVRPDMVATKGLYKIVRCPNYFGEILFWTGLTVSGLDAIQGVGQWITVILGYICIVIVMFNGAQRLEKRQMKRYGENAEYTEYANKTPIIIPLLPIYHLNKQEK